MNIACRIRPFVLVLALSASLPAGAATIYDVSGPSPFGFNNQNPVAIGWSSSLAYTHVSITIPLADLSAGGPMSGVEGAIYLMSQVGPATTSANEVAPPVSISGLTATFTPHLVFSGLTLGPGNYYIVFVSTQTGSLSNSMEGSSTPVKTTGTGITEIGWLSGLTPAAYPPATTALGGTPEYANAFMTITGDPAATGIPMLSTVGLLALIVAIGVLAVYRRA